MPRKTEELEEAAAALGFTLYRKGKHLIWRHPNGATVVSSQTPSDGRARLNTLARMRRLSREEP